MLNGKPMIKPMLNFDHFYPRYGLAVVLSRKDLLASYDAGSLDRDDLYRAAFEIIQSEMNRFRMHYPGSEDDPQLKYRYLSVKDLKSSGQKAADLYYIAPHVVTSAGLAANHLVRHVLKLFKPAGGIESWDGDLDDLIPKSGSTDQMKRSFAPVTQKLNAGGSLTNTRETSDQALFTLVTTLTGSKPASYAEENGDWSNQALIPDLPLKEMVRFVTIFDMMQTAELTLENREDSNNKRPPVFNGNYPHAPRSSAFGAVGLMGAIGKWAREAGYQEWASTVLQALAGRSIYRVSYDRDRFESYSIGHHVARLAEEIDLPDAIGSLYNPRRTRFYNKDDNSYSAPKRKLFYQMASRFLRLYDQHSFRTFLSFRVEYDAALALILNDYFMQSIPKDIVDSAAAYGDHLNRQAYFVARNEVNNKDTGRSIYEAKSSILSAMESTATSSRSAPELFGRLNTDVGRKSLRDVPSEANLFIKEAVAGEKLDFDTTRNLVLSFMRVSTYDPEEAKEAESEETGDEEVAEVASSDNIEESLASIE